MMPAQAQTQKKAPDFTGVYGRDAHNFPKPYSKSPRGYGIEGGFNNELLRPWVVELLDRDALVEKAGRGIVTAHSVCYPEGVPYVFGGTTIQILQTPTEITFIYADPGQIRTVYLNRAHPEHVTPSWWGDSVAHFEGDELVIDTIGIAYNPQAGTMGFFGTPHTNNLHLVERYRYLKPGEVSTAPPAKDDAVSKDAVIAGAPNLRMTYTVDDPIAYKKPWSITLDYLPLNTRVREYICAENSRQPDLSPMLPTADVPDF